ncbi:MAG: DUF2064 domain-containing protein [Bacteroidota bacterium]
MVFALSDKEEAKRKPFLANGGLVNSFNEHVQDIAGRCGLPVFNFDEAKQVGADFGSRFLNALQSVFATGFDGVIAIGNDTPQLSVAHIHRAKAKMENDEAVIGPTPEGGFYLLGLNRKDLDPAAFLRLSWNTHIVYQELVESFSNNATTYGLLETLRDINYFSALEKIDLRRVNNVTLRSKIRRAISGSEHFSFAKELALMNPVATILFNKGSPLLPSF